MPEGTGELPDFRHRAVGRRNFDEVKPVTVTVANEIRLVRDRVIRWPLGAQYVVKGMVSAHVCPRRIECFDRPQNRRFRVVARQGVEVIFCRQRTLCRSESGGSHREQSYQGHRKRGSDGNGGFFHGVSLSGMEFWTGCWQCVVGEGSGRLIFTNVDVGASPRAPERPRRGGLR